MKDPVRPYDDRTIICAPVRPPEWKERPEVEGYYWVWSSAAPTLAPELVQVQRARSRSPAEFITWEFGSEIETELKDWEGRGYLWCGPIPIPTTPKP